jgi:glutamate synthase domain-containing protein 2
MQCNKNTRATGITTQGPDLQKGLVAGNKQLRAASHIKNECKEIRVIAKPCGVKRPRDLNRIRPQAVIEHGNSKTPEPLYPRPTKK